MPWAGWTVSRAPGASDGCSTSQPACASARGRHARRAPQPILAAILRPQHPRATSCTSSSVLSCAFSPAHPQPSRCPRPLLGQRPWPARPVICHIAASASPGGAGSAAFGDPNALVGMLMAYAAQLQQQQQQQAVAKGSEVRVEGIGFHPPGCEKPLLQDVSIVLPANSLGLVIGRSGSGKTTLLQVLAGLTEQTAGQVRILRGGGGGGGGGGQQTGPPAARGVPYPSNGNSSNGVNNSNGNGSGHGYAASSNGSSWSNGNGNGASAAAAGIAPAAAGAPSGLTVEQRMQQVGLVFQFPERHFLGEDLMQELTFTWPQLTQFWGERQALSIRMQQVLQSVGLEDIPLHVSPWALSGGQQRRLALAIQLVRQPALLLLDEPLAGLDWTSRQEVVTILRKLKEQCTLLVVSHDLAEIAPLVDCAWTMHIGGTCEPAAWPPADLAGLEQ